MGEIWQLQDIVKNNLPAVDMPVTHHHSVGTYVREIFMPAGSVVIGKVHATRHINILLTGECTIWTVQGKHKMKAPCIFESMAGVKKVLYMHTDVRYLTVHPTDETDEGKLEGTYIRPEEQGELFPELDSMLIGSEE